MTTQRLSSEKLVDFSLFKNLTLRRLPHILVAFLASFFTTSVPFLMNYGDYDRYANRELSYIVDRAVRDMGELMVLNLLATYGLALYFGIITLGYMMKRRSAHFYHALPQRRETLYFTSIVSALFCVGVGCLVNLAIAAVELVIFEVAFPEVISLFFSLTFQNAIAFITTYAITVFAGSFSGNGLVQALMTAVIFFYPLATYAAVINFRDMFTRYFDSSYFFSEHILEWLSPVAYKICNYNSDEGIRIFPLIIALLVSAALILGGLEIYKKRAVENSEKPIVFRKVGRVLMYMFMFSITIFAGIFFFSIARSTFNLIFGFVSGAVLSFMLFNTILEKTPKAMFKGIKGLSIFASVFLVFILVFGFDVLGIDSYVPAADNIKSAEISIDSSSLNAESHDDRATIEALSTLFENQNKVDKTDFVTPVDVATGYRVTAVMMTKLGFPISRTYYVSKYTEGSEEFLEAYVNSGSIEAEFNRVFAALIKLAEDGFTADMRTKQSSREEQTDFREFLEIYIREFGVADYDRLSKPMVGYVYLYDFYDGNSRYYSIRDFVGNSNLNISDELPIFADMTDTIEYLGIDYSEYDLKTRYVNSDGTRAELSSAAIIDTRKAGSTYPAIPVSNELGEELYYLLAKYNEATLYTYRAFTAIDTDYAFRITFGDEDEKAYEKIMAEKGLAYVEMALATEDSVIRGLTVDYVFPKGYVPSIVKDIVNMPQ